MAGNGDGPGETKTNLSATLTCPGASTHLWEKSAMHSTPFWIIALGASLATIMLMGAPCASVEDIDGNNDGMVDGDGGDSSSNDDSDTGASGRPYAAFDDNVSAIESATATAKRMLAAEEGVDDINAALVDELLAQPAVSDATIDSTSGFVVAHFGNGEIQSFEVIGAESTDGLTELQTTPTPSGNISMQIGAPSHRPAATDTNAIIEQVPDFSGLDGYRALRIPSKSLALHANAISHFHPEWPSNSATNVIAKMLESRGYTVTQKPLTLQHLRELHQYGVILIETHGLWHDNSGYMDALICPGPDLTTDENSIPNCGGDNSLNALLTTTTTSDEPVASHKEDLKTGRLYLHNRIRNLVVNGTVVQQVATQYYAATTHFVRQYSQGDWSENVIFMLNACQGFRATDNLSPWNQLVAEKAKDGVFLGWDKKLNYVYAAEAALNLFQLMTASSEDVIINEIALLVVDVPPNGMRIGSLGMVYDALQQEGLLTSKGNAHLLRRTSSSEGFDYLLMPNVHGWEAPYSTEDPESGNARILMWSEPGTQVRIGGDEIAVTPYMLCCADYWMMQDKPTIYGNIRAEWKGRFSVLRPVHLWKPQINVNGSSGGMTYQVQMHLQGRASMDGRSYRDQIWDEAPPAQFGLQWDPKGSAYSWQVSGEETFDDGNLEYKYSGAGSHVFGEDDWGTMETSSDGRTVSIAANVAITYDVTITNHEEDSTTTYQQGAGISISRDGTVLSDNWTVAADTYTDNVGPGAGTVSWSEFAADPPFLDESTPR